MFINAKDRWWLNNPRFGVRMGPHENRGCDTKSAANRFGAFADAIWCAVDQVAENALGTTK
jgi:hypothetical protein